MRRSTMISEQEWDLLAGLPPQAIVLYTRVFRRFMDDASGLVGDAPGRLVTPKKCEEELFVEPHRGRKESGSPSRWTVRRLVEWLVKAGLLERRTVPAYPQAMCFFMPVAWRHLEMIREARAERLAQRAAARIPAPITRTEAASPKPAESRATPRPTQDTRTQPARNPHATRTQSAPQPAPQPAPQSAPMPTGSSPPPKSPEAAFYRRFGAESPAEKRTPPPPTPFSDPEKAAPKPHATRTEAAPATEAPKPLPVVPLTAKGRKFLEKMGFRPEHIPAPSSEIGIQNSEFCLDFDPPGTIRPKPKPIVVSPEAAKGLAEARELVKRLNA